MAVHKLLQQGVYVFKKTQQSFMHTAEMYTKLLSLDLQTTDLKIIVNNYNSREKKMKLGAFLIENKDKICEIFKWTNSHEIRILVLKIICKTLSKKQITQTSFFRAMTKKAIEMGFPGFLIHFNFLFNHKITCAQFTQLICVEKNVDLTKGAVFMDTDSMKFYAGNNTVILYNSSIIEIAVSKKSLEILAKADKTVTVTLDDSEQSMVFIAETCKVYKGKTTKNINELDDVNGILQGSTNTQENESVELKQLQSILQSQRIMKCTFDLEKNEEVIIPNSQIIEQRPVNEAQQELLNMQVPVVPDAQEPEFVNSSEPNDLPENKTNANSSKKMIENDVNDDSSLSIDEFKNHRRTKRRTKRLRNLKSKQKKTKITCIGSNVVDDINEWFDLYMKLNKNNFKKLLRIAKKRKKEMLSLARTKIRQ
ncbi:hypothetical protein ECANGB1_27 [Enterospora canceri]|uniref:Uncharacterized protein n=1 Tax=Enterospora canceri TaxID=1081671 RepID=A0A1Y1S8B3_9MICR|nr:hypothetical protein ECANGB1_27 [Enterospora canceri]